MYHIEMFNVQVESCAYSLFIVSAVKYIDQVTLIVTCPSYHELNLMTRHTGEFNSLGRVFKFGIGADQNNSMRVSILVT